jgi:hypothetical protein
MQATIERLTVREGELAHMVSDCDEKRLQQIRRAEAAEARIATLEGAASFLIDRLGEYEVPEEGSRDWFGHVVPALERLAALAHNQPQEGTDPEETARYCLLGQLRKEISAEPAA